MIFVDVLEFSVEEIDVFAQFIDFDFEFGVFELLFLQIRAEFVALDFEEGDHVIFDFGLGDFDFFGGLFLCVFMYFGDFLFRKILSLSDLLL